MRHFGVVQVKTLGVYDSGAQLKKTSQLLRWRRTSMKLAVAETWVIRAPLSGMSALASVALFSGTAETVWHYALPDLGCGVFFAYAPLS